MSDDEFMYSSGDEVAFDFEDDSEYDSEIVVDSTAIAIGQRRNLESGYFSFSVLSITELEKRKNELVNNAMQLLNLDYDKTQTILANYRWKSEKLLDMYMEQPEKVFLESGVAFSPNKSAFEFMKHDSKYTCPIMFETGDEFDFYSLQCNHNFCSLCYKQYIVGKIRDRVGYRINCPEYKCNLCLGESQILDIVGDSEDIKLYKKTMIQSFVESTETLAWCTGPNCDKAIEFPSYTKSIPKDTIPIVTCDCGESFCFHCKGSNHKPAVCLISKLWIQKCNDDSETFNWLASNTKDCPKCAYPIEKNGGCNHITCRNCSYEFCWVCLKIWNIHKENYNCNIYVGPDDNNEDEEFEDIDEEAAAELNTSSGENSNLPLTIAQANQIDNQISNNKSKKLKPKDVKSSRESLEKYLFHFIRYDNQEKSIKLTQNLIDRTERKIDSFQKKSSLSWIETQFLKDAIIVLTNCRNTLKWSFVVSYYLAKNNMNAIFEDNQRDLERAVEKLNELVESDITVDNIDDVRRKILDLSAYVSDRNKIFLKDTLDGYTENRWKFNVPI
ncbi:E3 ubiquitin-protein ligase dbl4 [Smittium culicis]|uniref:RBR-type E3 ubiquitin transferase n=1 Tax=Smittium culicis TaxID=133412 RepID=A0A1R1YA26_9FUNG|nr:E3 ubiquitin-protein ligase dbl4 [Smittium culicis]